MTKFERSKVSQVHTMYRAQAVRRVLAGEQARPKRAVLRDPRAVLAPVKAGKIL